MSGYGRVILEDAAVEGERVSLRPISKQDARACFDLVHGVDAITSVDQRVYRGAVHHLAPRSAC